VHKNEEKNIPDDTRGKGNKIPEKNDRHAVRRVKWKKRYEVASTCKGEQPCGCQRGPVQEKETLLGNSSSGIRYTKRTGEGEPVKMKGGP